MLFFCWFPLLLVAAFVSVADRLGVSRYDWLLLVSLTCTAARGERRGVAFITTAAADIDPVQRFTPRHRVFVPQLRLLRPAFVRAFPRHTFVTQPHGDRSQNEGDEDKSAREKKKEEEKKEEEDEEHEEEKKEEGGEGGEEEEKKEKQVSKQSMNGCVQRMGGASHPA